MNARRCRAFREWDEAIRPKKEKKSLFVVAKEGKLRQNMVLTLSAETTESKFELGRGRTVVHLQFYRIECGRGFGSIHERIYLPIQDRFPNVSRMK